MTYDWRITPTHEAGHIAAAWLLAGDDAILGPATLVESAWTVASATVGVSRPSAEALEEAWHSATVGIPVKSAVRYYVETSVMIWLAGAVAEYHAAKRRRLFELPTAVEPETPKQQALKAAAIAAGESEPDSDSENVGKLLAHVSGSKAEAEAYRAWLLERTHLLVETNLFDSLVDAIVAELTEHQTLKREAILAIIHRVMDLPTMLAAQVRESDKLERSD